MSISIFRTRNIFFYAPLRSGKRILGKVIKEVAPKAGEVATEVGTTAVKQAASTASSLGNSLGKAIENAGPSGNDNKNPFEGGQEKIQHHRILN